LDLEKAGNQEIDGEMGSFAVAGRQAFRALSP